MLFVDHFCFWYALTTYQMHLAYWIQLCLPIILIFSLVIKILSTSLRPSKVINLEALAAYGSEVNLIIESSLQSFVCLKIDRDHRDIERTSSGIQMLHVA